MGFKVKKEFAVIGLGTFGISVVETLLQHNINVIALDRDEEKIQKIANKVDFACTIDTTDEEALNPLSINFCRLPKVVNSTNTQTGKNIASIYSFR